MKINSGSPNNLYSCYNEARGVAQNKNYVLRKKKAKTWTFLQTSIINTFLIAIILLCIISYCDLSYWYLLLCFVPIVFNHIYLFFYLRKIKRYQKRFFNIFDEDGIHDESFYGIKMLFTWKKIQAIVIGRKSIVVLTDTPCYFYYGIDKKHDILDAIEMYSKKKKIIM